jgi:maltose alpha-D-glucosyltransferase/alpha-amylase
MRLNMGIRRRLAPLLANDLRRIKLANSLLLTFIGSPVIYYGDEIGMGDNIYLGDRNGVRTPMQWSADRNAGFSGADASTLYSPVITDPVYGYQVVNVEAQLRTPSSLLQWMRALIATRKTTRVFGRGRLRFLHPANARVVAYLREHDGDTVLVAANLAASAEPVELDLSEYQGTVPVEMLGGTRFPPIRREPYVLSLGPYTFFWFRLTRPGATEASYGIERTAL